MSIKTYINLDYSATNEKFDNYILDWIHADERVVLQCKESHSVRHYERYTKVVPQEKEWIFEIQRNNEIPKYFGYQPKRLLRGRIWGIEKYRPSTDSLKKIQEEKYYVIFPGSLLEQKKWPADKFAQLIDSTSDLGFLPIICGNSSEKSSGNLIQHLCKTQTVNLMGQTSLMDLAYIIKNARFLISNDTSAVHIAAAVGTPVSVILGGGHYGRFLPYPGIDTVIPVVHEQYRDCFQCYWNCKYGDTRCVKEISVEEMKKNVNYLYNKINH
jgi:ADP-heptose:LPS heptosyltransferase